MNQPMQVTITLDARESAALRSVAARELRRPKDQARYLLRQVLLGGINLLPENANRGAMDSHPQRAAAAS